MTTAAAPVSVLITQCLQRDFVMPLRPHDPLPNRLHIGAAESERLLGADPATGPLAQLMSWARAQPLESLAILHIRDWHDANDPRQGEHLHRFGDHCIAGTGGAEMAFEGQPGDAPAANECFVDATTLNDFEGTELVARLERLRGQGHELRVGVVGVWTEAKVSYLLYDLKTRLGIDALATCSALTASASRTQHFNALEQLHRLLGVECFNSLAEFTGWLRPGSTISRLASAQTFDVEVAIEDGALLSDSDRAITTCLFRESTEVALRRLSGGFSGADVYQARSRDAFGHVQAPSVLKLGAPSAVARERVAFERIEEVLGNHAPQVRGFADIGERAGIRYSYAAMGQGSVRSLQQLVADGTPTGAVASVIDQVFGEVLAPLYAAARPEPVDLLAVCGFSPSLAATVTARVAALVGDAAAAAESIDLAEGGRRANVARFYSEVLTATPVLDTEDRSIAFVHGDLNGANVLVDAHDNVWVIDYFFTGPAPVLTDAAKLENDLLYIMTPLSGVEDLRQAIRLTDQLIAITDLTQPLPPLAADIDAPQLQRSWALLTRTRAAVAALSAADPDPYPMQVALLSLAARTIGYAEPSVLQRRWALASAGRLAELVTARLEQRGRLRVDWLSLLDGQPGDLGLTLCPGRRDRNRSLVEDVDQLQRDDVDLLVLLLEDEEITRLGVENLLGVLGDRGIGSARLPIRDGAAPAVADVAALSHRIRTELGAGHRVVLACRGGLGRSGTIAACVLVDGGLPAPEAIQLVRRARGPRAIDFPVQEAFVGAYGSRTDHPSS